MEEPGSEGRFTVNFSVNNSVIKGKIYIKERDVAIDRLFDSEMNVFVKSVNIV